jgi:multidrug efflux system membrane fusion protein
MQLNRTFKVGLLISGLSLLVACGSEPGAQQPQQMAPAVSVAEVVHQRITEWDEFTGRLEAPESVSLRPRVSGYIDSIAFKEGAIVEAGQPLFYIDDRSFKAEVRRLDAELADANSRLKLAKSSFVRATELAEKQAISDEIFDSRVAELEQAKARLRSTKAAIEIAKLNLSYTKVTAPITGRISRALITAGNLVNAGQTELTSIVSANRVYAYFDADEQTYLKYMALAKEGTRPSSREVKNPVYMGLANESDFPNEGYIDFIDNQINPATGTIRGRAVFDNAEDKFIPGLFTRIKLVGSASYDGILIDDKAVATDLGNKYVMVLDGDNKVQYRAITLGEKLNGLRIVKSGLNAGDSIVVNGLQRVRPGAQVVPEIVPMAKTDALEQLQAQQLRVDNSLQRWSIAGDKGATLVSESTRVGG